MRITRLVRASFSAAVFATRKSFEKQLDNSPTTLFNYYCQLQNGSRINNNDLQWKKVMRGEWEMLSHTRRRLYFAFYFHFERINHRSLNKFELAKFLEIPTPAISEYMMFRNFFKCKFEKAWLENCKNLTSSRKGKLVKKSPIAGGHRISVYIPLNRKQLLLEVKNHTKRYQRMCRECRHIWNGKITSEQKMLVRQKWEQEKRQFDENINTEIKTLEINLSKLHQLESQEKFFQVKRKNGELIENKNS